MSKLIDLYQNEPSVISLQPGEYLFREGEPSKETMYVLIAGKAEVRISHITVEEAEPSAIVGEIGIIHPNESRTASVIAMTPCDFVEIGPKRFDYLVSSAPEFAREVMRVLADRLRRADRMIE